MMHQRQMCALQLRSIFAIPALLFKKAHNTKASGVIGMPVSVLCMLPLYNFSFKMIYGHHRIWKEQSTLCQKNMMYLSFLYTMHTPVNEISKQHSIINLSFNRRKNTCGRVDKTPTSFLLIGFAGVSFPT